MIFEVQDPNVLYQGKIAPIQAFNCRCDCIRRESAHSNAPSTFGNSTSILHRLWSVAKRSEIYGGPGRAGRSSLPQQQAPVVVDVKHKPDWPLSTTFAHTSPVVPRSACSCPFAQGGGITGGGEGVAADRNPFVRDRLPKCKARQGKATALVEMAMFKAGPLLLRSPHLQKLKKEARWRQAPVPQQQVVTPFDVVEAQRPATLLMTTFAHTRLAALSSAGSASVCPAWQTAPANNIQPSISGLRMAGQQACFAQQDCSGECLSPAGGTAQSWINKVHLNGTQLVVGGTNRVHDARLT